MPTILAAGLAAGGILVGCVVGLAIGATRDLTSPAAISAAGTDSPPPPGTAFPAIPPPPTTIPAPAAPAAPSVDDGTWTVGIDLPAGTYRTTAVVSSDCYWGIYKSGTNGNDIIANDIPGGGRPTVTVKAGQDFRTARCGTWVKIK